MSEGLLDRLAPYKVSMKREKVGGEVEAEFIDEIFLSVALIFYMCYPDLALKCSL